VVVAISYRWSTNGGTSIYAIARMLIQLLLVGYVLAFIFETDRPSIVFLVLAVMLFAASWIALRPIRGRSGSTYARALASIAIGGLSTLAIVTQGVLDLTPWYRPQFVVPLAGMIFSSSMNTVSLAAERFQAERARDANYIQARNTAFGAALIPLLNTLFAVGVVSIPGMMTGQILSGVQPLVAARYQIMVMCMIFGSAGISAACYLTLARSDGSRG
jgi:putative ABC transport system permease protein